MDHSKNSATRSLYDRLGGEDRIRAIAGTIFDRHIGNPAVQRRYVASDREALIPILTAFVSAGTGGPQTYTGKDMLVAHRGMNISDQEFVAVLDDILAALDEHGVGQREKEELLMICWSLKDQIVRQ
ncbi:Cyanoglobin; Hemoglobin-like protein HbN [Thioalkalivibrio nitratireducens DSM 14787]|uniref:Cyanoglobin Hemoglobin-like protein HbN n=1 Tax=Thioalkalivibrio nitratireducens (strain DSM 14787 / UNIQEM 213 / ALEN2) TaxID=1255043 RepID=L0DT35_THIND|nr:Cyanoglobin; Hemoglobin-like protein HbN [Thioalkalivibrio nitratireducens DSM 14787]